jgi:environmental stress-induced protein Ves
VCIVRFDALRPVPWKNGGETTIEIVAHPPGATLDAFEWRVSAAEIHRDGPFSRFDGVDRTLAILDGDGLVLDFGERIARVGPKDPPFLFHGESPASARPLGGFVRDLNVMTRRAAWRATMVRHTLTPETTLPAEGETRVSSRSTPVRSHEEPSARPPRCATRWSWTAGSPASRSISVRLPESSQSPSIAKIAQNRRFGCSRV